MRNFTLRACLAVMVGLLLACGGAGCSGTHADKGTKQALQKNHDQAKIDAGKAADKGTVNDAKGKADPVAHPLDSSGVIVKRLRAVFVTLAVFFAVELVAGFALKAWLTAALSSKFVSLGWRGLTASTALAFACPFFPTIFYGTVAAIAVWFLVELALHKWSFTGALDALEADLKNVIGETPISTTVASADGSITTTVGTLTEGLQNAAAAVAAKI